MDPLDKPDPLDDIISTSQAPPIQATNNYQDQERYTPVSTLKCVSIYGPYLALFHLPVVD
jgi:hypothetical protein